MKGNHKANVLNLYTPVVSAGAFYILRKLDFLEILPILRI